MGDVVALVKVMPTSAEVDLQQLKRRIEAAMPDGIALNKITEEPVAFGLVALKVNVQMADEGGAKTEKLEGILGGLDDVESAEVTDVGRLM